MKTRDLIPVEARRGRRKLDPRWWMPRRERRLLPAALVERLESCLRPVGNRDACGRLASFLTLANRRSGAFALCRRALAKIAAVGLTSSQIRRAIDRLLEIGFIERVGGGEFDRETGTNRPVLYRLAWAVKWPKASLRLKKTKIGAISSLLSSIDAPGLFKGLIPVAGTIEATRAAARAALDRLREQPTPRLSTAALLAGRRGGRR